MKSQLKTSFFKENGGNETASVMNVNHWIMWLCVYVATTQDGGRTVRFGLLLIRFKFHFSKYIACCCNYSDYSERLNHPS